MRAGCPLSQGRVQQVREMPDQKRWGSGSINPGSRVRTGSLVSLSAEKGVSENSGYWKKGCRPGKLGARGELPERGKCS